MAQNDFPQDTNPYPDDTLNLLSAKIARILKDGGGGGGGGLTDEELRATPVPVSGTISSSPVGAPNYANGQVAASTSAATLLAARATRRSAMFVNMDAAITVYIGAATVSASNGVPLKPGQSISIDALGLFQVIAASGSPVVAFIEVYD